MGNIVKVQQGSDCYTMTLPMEIAKKLKVSKGDHVVVEWDEEQRVATIRKISVSPRRRAHQGAINGNTRRPEYAALRSGELLSIA